MGDGDEAEDIEARGVGRCVRDKTPGGEGEAVNCRGNKYAAKISLLAVLSASFLLLSSCWSNRDLTDVNIATALGIDISEDGKLVASVQVVEPAAIQSTSSGKSKGGGASNSKPTFVESYEGETVFDALRNMLSMVDKKLFLGTVQVLILGEKLSEDDINNVLDFFQRYKEMEYDTVDVLIAKDVAPKDLLQIENDMDPISAMYIKETAKNTVLRGMVKQTMLIDLIKDMGDDGKQIAIGQITKAGDKEVKTEGTAVFRGGKLGGWLDPIETRGYLFAIDKIKCAIINVQADEGKISMEVMSSKGKINVKFEKGKPVLLNIQVKLEANVGEYEAKGNLDSPDELHKLEKILSEEVRREIMMALDRAQKDYLSDIFGFDTQVHKYHPAYWKKAKKSWNEIFSKLPADIHVDAEIERTGIIKGPVKKGE